MKHKRWALAWTMVLLLLGITGSQALGETETPFVHEKSAKLTWMDQMRQTDRAAAQAWVEEEWTRLVKLMTQTKAAQEVRTLIEEIQEAPWWADVEAWRTRVSNWDYQQEITRLWQNVSTVGEQLAQRLNRWLENVEIQLQ